MIKTAPQSFYLFFWLAWVTGLAWLFYSQAHTGATAGPEVCLFKGITHIPCPACGSTHAALSLLRGDWTSAWQYNPLGILIVIALAILPGWALIDVISGKDSLFSTYQLIISRIERPIWAFPAVALVLLNWIWNIVKAQ